VDADASDEQSVMPVIRRKLATVPVAWKPDDTQRLLTVKQAGKYLGFGSGWHIRQLFKRGELRPVRIGRCEMVDRADLDAFIERMKSAERTT
jgi:excisionase family DNA binding protein